MINIEARPSATGMRAAPGRSSPIRIGGAPPGRGFAESFSSRTSNSFRQKSAEFRANHNNFKQKVESPGNPEAKRNIISPRSKRGSERFKHPQISKKRPEIKAGIPDTFYKAFNEKAPELKGATAIKRDELRQKPKPENLLKNFQKVEAKNLAEIPKVKPGSFETVKIINIPKPEAAPMQKAVEVAKPVKQQEKVKAEIKSILVKPEVKDLVKKALEQKGPTRLQSKIDSLTKIGNLRAEVDSILKPKTESGKLLKDQTISLQEAFKVEAPKEVKLNTESINPLKAKTSEIAKLIKDQKVSLSEAVLKDSPAIEIIAESLDKPERRNFIAQTLRNSQIGIADAMVKFNSEVKVSELGGKTFDQLGRELVADALRNNKVSLAEVSGKEAVNRKNQVLQVEQLTRPLSLALSHVGERGQAKTLLENLTDVREALLTGSQPVTEKLSVKLTEQIIDNPTKVIDFVQARELIEKSKSSDVVQVAKPEIKSLSEMTQITEELKPIVRAEQKINPTLEQQVKVKALSEALLNPEIKVVISPEQRAEAIETVKLLVEMAEYQTNPEMYQQTKEMVKEIERQVVEEQQIIETVISMKAAGMIGEEILPIISAQVEAKQLPLDSSQIESIFTKAERRLVVLTENKGEGEELKEQDDLEELLREMRRLFIELDEKALAKRFELLYGALEKAYQKALNNGKESFSGSDVISELPSFQPKEIQSDLIKDLDQNDGGEVIGREEMKSASIEFRNIQDAYQFLGEILLRNRPGKLSDRGGNPITEEEIRKIFQDRPLPQGVTNGTIIQFPPPVTTQTLTAI